MVSRILRLFVQWMSSRRIAATWMRSMNGLSGRSWAPGVDGLEEISLLRDAFEIWRPQKKAGWPLEDAAGRTWVSDRLATAVVGGQAEFRNVFGMFSELGFCAPRIWRKALEFSSLPCRVAVGWIGRQKIRREMK
eukprot:s2357_g13.t1